MRLTVRYLCLAALILVGGCGSTFYSEPTEADMMVAVENQMKETGFGGEQGEMVVRNPFSNLHMKLAEVAKASCTRANEGPGYICTYRARMTTAVTSNETSADGIEHARAADAVLGLFTGGSNGIWDSHTQRFIRTWDGWKAVPL